MHPKYIYSFGYERRSPDELLFEVLRLGAVVIDTRLVPQSRRPEWSHDSLRDFFPNERYIWIEAFGNLNYKSGMADFLLKDPDEGLRLITPWLRDSACILLCYEADPQECHRSEVARLVAERFGLLIIHLYRDQMQLSLF